MARTGGLLGNVRRMGEAVSRAGALAAGRSDAAASTALAVELAIRDAPPRLPVPAEIYGPLEVVAVMAAPVLAQRWEIEVTDESLGEIVYCLLDAWTQELALSTREHFEAWRTTRSRLSTSAP